jgi:ketosteroid isomerase-like protein
MMEAANKKEASVDRRENIRGFYDAAARGDVSAVLDLLDPEIEWRSPESLPWGGTYHGREGVREELSKLLDQPVEFRREAREWFDEGDWAVVLLRVFGRHKGAGIRPPTGEYANDGPALSLPGWTSTTSPSGPSASYH